MKHVMKHIAIFFRSIVAAAVLTFFPTAWDISVGSLLYTAFMMLFTIDTTATLGFHTQYIPATIFLLAFVIWLASEYKEDKEKANQEKQQNMDGKEKI